MANLAQLRRDARRPLARLQGRPDRRDRLRPRAGRRRCSTSTWRRRCEAAAHRGQRGAWPTCSTRSTSSSAPPTPTSPSRPTSTLNTRVGDAAASARRTTARSPSRPTSSGNPAISIPVGTVDGLPVGMQVIGRHHEDALLLDLALVGRARAPVAARGARRARADSGFGAAAGVAAQTVTPPADTGPMTKNAQLTLIDTPRAWQLDERTREVGREGIARARAALRAGPRTAGRPARGAPPPRPPPTALGAHGGTPPDARPRCAASAGGPASLPRHGHPGVVGGRASSPGRWPAGSPARRSRGASPRSWSASSAPSSAARCIGGPPAPSRRPFDDFDLGSVFVAFLGAVLLLLVLQALSPPVPPLTASLDRGSAPPCRLTP